VLAGVCQAEAGAYASHPPQRPLPAVSYRAMASGPGWFVDGARGDDAADGSEVRPWRTVARAARALRPGDTLYLRGGIYREAVTLAVAGAVGRPITVRSYPGELVVIDRGIPDFYDDPARAWVPAAGGARGEFVSAQAFPEVQAVTEEPATNVEGNFADSLVPILGVRFLGDLRSDNPYGTWVEPVPAAERKKGGPATRGLSNQSEGVRIYCGPSLWYDPKTHRIHARLAHTRLPGLDADGANYRGETDPRRLKLVVSARGRGVPMSLRGARYLRVQDLVLRGGFEAALVVEYGAGIVLEGVTAYGGATVMSVTNTAGLRLLDCAFRGRSAPWIFRSHLKYRAIESSLVAAGGWNGGGNRDFEIAWSEFTDTVDGLFLGGVDGVHLHHCYLDNVSDDGLFVTAPTLLDGRVTGGNITIVQSYLGRMLTTLACGVGHGRQKVMPGDGPAFRTGAGVWVTRNVFDFRTWVYYFVPNSPKAPQEFTFMGRLAGDHGSPAWEPLRFYQNTVISGDGPWRDHYAGGLGALGVGNGTPRRLFNNIFATVKGMPGSVLPTGGAELAADGNLHWSFAAGAATDEAAFLAGLRRSAPPAAGAAESAPAWAARDRFADPRFFHFDPRPASPLDLRLTASSPAAGAGVRLPPDCPDPLAASPAARPDIGAIPVGADPWRVGVRGRYTMFGQLVGLTVPTALVHRVSLTAEEQRPWRPAVLVGGHGDTQTEALAFAIEQAHFAVERQAPAQLPRGDLSRYAVIVCDGSPVAPDARPPALGKSDLARLAHWLRGGGTLLLTARSLPIFEGQGARFLASLGLREPPGGAAGAAPSVLQPDHPWVAHLPRRSVPPWLAGQPFVPLECDHSDTLIGDRSGRSILCRVPAGRGQLVYLGWSIRPIADSRAGVGDRNARLTEERELEDQVTILVRIAESLAPAPPPASRKQPS
jgi:hypothetical protein